jgi:PIN domain nuclease of toxin-antitoxin system
MNYLLDTHALIWYLEAASDLSSKASAIIRDKNNTIFVSSINFWEIAIKSSTGKLGLSMSLGVIIQETQNLGFQLLPIENTHILKVETLPFHHRDPFDRLLIAQSQVENMILLSKDENMPLYDVNVLW